MENQIQALFDFYKKERGLSETAAIKKVAETIKVTETEARAKINQEKPITLRESDNTREEIKQSFIDLGMSESEAETAARGRDSGNNEQCFKDIGLSEVEAKEAVKGRYQSKI